MLQSLCVIPARSGSKGLKNKNILDLCGKPVLAYTIEACRECGLFRDVYVATDSEEYAELARQHGAKVPFLEPAAMAEDAVSSTEPLLYFAEQLGDESELLWCFQPTSPLRTAQDILDAYACFEKYPACDFVVGTTEIDPHYFHWALAEQPDGMMDLYFGKKMLVDRSLLTPRVYRPNGAIKAGRRKALFQWRGFFGENIQRVEMPDERAIHIRSQFDLDVCRYLLSGKDGKP